MANIILSDIVEISKPEELTTEYIENEILKQYGKVLRWAIVEVLDKSLKIGLTYEKEA